MAGQNYLNIDLTPFIIEGYRVIGSGTLAQDAERATPLAQYTVLAYDAANDNWVPLTDVDAQDGTNWPAAIYMGAAITAAALVAGDVDTTELLLGGACQVDKSKVVLENALTLASILLYVNTGGTNGSLGTIEQCLRRIGIFMTETDGVDDNENA